jgi:iron(II)-dependent oxidoreductase
VVNALYARFVSETGRPWPSPAGRGPGASNLPATDLTWHDARAFCAWATAAFRAEGRIAATETVRLPTEPEWEFAARGPAGRTWPWGEAWDADRANSEELGLNAPCAVGLFPAGASPFGCLDMAGQVWEWVSTLWGRAMATPDFAYPWRPDDGREEVGAPDAVRRVLRGGCFASPATKANALYRGSLEADGFWRGNGFRIVIAEEVPQ